MVRLLRPSVLSVPVVVGSLAAILFVTFWGSSRIQKSDECNEAIDSLRGAVSSTAGRLSDFMLTIPPALESGDFDDVHWEASNVNRYMTGEDPAYASDRVDPWLPRALEGLRGCEGNLESRGVADSSEQAYLVARADVLESVRIASMWPLEWFREVAALRPEVRCGVELFAANADVSEAARNATAMGQAMLEEDFSSADEHARRWEVSASDLDSSYEGLTSCVRANASTTSSSEFLARIDEWRIAEQVALKHTSSALEALRHLIDVSGR